MSYSRPSYLSAISLSPRARQKYLISSSIKTFDEDAHSIYDDIDDFETAYTFNARVTLQTTDNNFYVETYEKRIILYLKYYIMNSFPNMNPGTANSIAEGYCVYKITREKEPRPEDIPAEVVNFMNSNEDVINLQRLAPFIPLTKVQVPKNPGRLTSVFRYILRSFEHMGDKYRREHLKKAVVIGRVTLKLASSLHTKAQVIILIFDIQGNAIQDIIDGLNHGSGAEITEEIKSNSDQLLYDIVGTQKHLKIATTFYDSVILLCKYVRTSAAHRQDAIKTANKLDVLLKVNKELVLDLQKQINTLVDQAKQCQETINVVGLSLEQRLESLTCMSIPFIYKLTALSEFIQDALLLCQELQPLVQDDMNDYFATKRVAKPPTVYTSGSSVMVSEPPIVRFEPVGILTADRLVTASKMSKKFSLFRPITIDPGRTSAYAAYYGNEQKRKLGTKEYYAHGDQGSRAKKMKRKENGSKLAV